MGSGPTGEAPRLPLVAVLDYPGRRTEAAVAELSLSEHGFDVCYLLTEPLPSQIDPDRYTGELVARLPQGRPVRAVLAYCLAGALGQHLAAVLARTGPPPRLVLFDAGPAGADAVVEAFHAAVTQMGGRAADDPDLRELLGRGRAGRAEAAAIIHDSLHRLAVAALIEDGEAVEDVEVVAVRLIERHAQWLAHLIAASAVGEPGWGGDLLHVISREHPFEGDWPGARHTTTIRIDCSRNDLLRTAATRQAVTVWLDSPGTGLC